MEYGISIVGWGYGIMKGGDLCVLDPADQPFHSEGRSPYHCLSSLAYLEKKFVLS